jgi:hypothetical protein
MVHAWDGTWTMFIPRIAPRTARNGQSHETHIARSEGCPRQCPPAGFEPALPPPRPVDLVLADTFRCPTWASCSRPVSPVTSSALSFIPRGIPRGVSSVDDFEALVLDEVRVVLDVERGEGEARGRGSRRRSRSRWPGAGDRGVGRRPGSRPSGRRRAGRRGGRRVRPGRFASCPGCAGPQRRTRVHLVSSP